MRLIPNKGDSWNIVKQPEIRDGKEFKTPEYKNKFPKLQTLRFPFDSSVSKDDYYVRPFISVVVCFVMDRDLLFGMASGGPNVKFLSYAGEGVRITRASVQSYQSQLVAVRQQASMQIAKPLIGLLSSVDNPISQQSFESSAGPAVHRGFGLSDEARAHQVAGVDRAEVDRIMSQLTFDTDPVHRAWATQQQQTAESGHFYNYGLNAHLLREYIGAQVALRIDKSRRVKITASTDVAGHRGDAHMRRHPERSSHRLEDPWRA